MLTFRNSSRLSSRKTDTLTQVMSESAIHYCGWRSFFYRQWHYTNEYMHKPIHKCLSLFYKIVLSLSLLLLSHDAFALGPPTVVTAGNQVPGATKIYWSVIGGSGTCKGAADYPSAAKVLDNVKSIWTTGVKGSTGEMSLDKVYADPGNVVGGYRDYVFTCTDTDPTSGASDSATLRVMNPCLAGFSWNTTSYPRHRREPIP